MKDEIPIKAWELALIDDCHPWFGEVAEGTDDEGSIEDKTRLTVNRRA